MNIEDDKVTFSSGLELYANLGIIGISPGLELSHGYDGPFQKLNADFDPIDFTPEEKEELAGHMIQRWTQWSRK